MATAQPVETARFYCPNCNSFFESGTIGQSVTLGEKNRQRCTSCNEVVEFEARRAPYSKTQLLNIKRWKHGESPNHSAGSIKS